MVLVAAALLPVIVVLLKAMTRAASWKLTSGTSGTVDVTLDDSNSVGDDDDSIDVAVDDNDAHHCHSSFDSTLFKYLT